MLSLRHLIIFSISAFTFSNVAFSQDPQGDGSFKYTTTPLEIVVPKDQWERLSPEGQKVAGFIIETLTTSVSRITDVEVTLPQSIFDGTQIVTPDDLLVIPDFESEVRQLGGRDLTRDQIGEISTTGTYKIASPTNPNIVHVWRISNWIQRGSNNIQVDIAQRGGAAVYEIGFAFPETLFGSEKWTLRSGLNRIWGAFNYAVDSLVGLRSTVARYSQYEVTAMLDNERALAIHENLPEVSAGRYQPDLRLIPTDDDSRERLGELQVKVSTILDGIYRKWIESEEDVSKRIQAQINNEVASGRVTEEQAPGMFLTLFATELDTYVIENLKKFSNDKTFEKFGPGIIELVIRNYQAERIIRTEEALWAEANEKLVAEELKKVQSAHPWLATVGPWLQRKEQRIRTDVAHRDQTGLEQLIVRKLVDAGLLQEADIVAVAQDFDTMVAPVTLAKFQSQRVPAIEREVSILKSWNKKDWVKKDSKTGRYYLESHISKITGSQFMGWRILHGVRRWQQSIKGFTSAILKDWMIDGPLGLKSLIKKDPFPVELDLDTETGQLVPSGKTRSTMRSRIAGLIAKAAKNRDEFRQNERSIIGPIARLWLLGWNDIGLGVLCPLALGIGQPVATVANTALSLVATGAALLPVVPLAEWATHATLFNLDPTDRSSSRRNRILRFLGRLVPPLTRVAGPTVVGGVEAVGATAVRGIAYNGSRTLLFTTQALYSAIARRAWDAVTLQAIKVWGTTRSRNSWEARRIAGPGITSEYSFQIDPNLVILSARVQMELAYLIAFEDNGVAELDKPTETVTDVLERPLFAATGSRLRGDNNDSVLTELHKDKTENEEKIEAAISDRRDLLSSILQIPGKGSIRLKKEPLMTALATTAAAAEAYFKPRLKTLSAETRKAFWKNRNLEANDWAGLASNLLSDTFGPNILVPLEEADERTSVIVESPDIAKTIEEILRGTPLNDLERYRVEEQLQVEGIHYPAGRTAMIPASDFCSASLIDLSTSNWTDSD